MKRVAIFDFDGTLADVEAIIIDLYKEVAAGRKWPELTDAKYKELRRGTVRDALRWVGVRPWQVPGLMRRGRTLFYKKSEQVELFQGVDSLLQQLDKDDWEIYVLSANSQRTIHRVLRRHELNHLVHVLRRPAIFGKATSINNLIRNKRYDRENVWMIGDEVRDVEAAHKAKIKSISVTWGLQDESVLMKYKPTAIAHKPSEIAVILSRG